MTAGLTRIIPGERQRRTALRNARVVPPRLIRGHPALDPAVSVLTLFAVALEPSVPARGIGRALTHSHNRCALPFAAAYAYLAFAPARYTSGAIAASRGS